jgi:hypothetical protein
MCANDTSFEVHEARERGRAVELDQYVDVAVGAGFAASHRPEHMQRRYAELGLQSRGQLANGCGDGVQCHRELAPSTARCCSFAP